jgi:hypothetical protein
MFAANPENEGRPVDRAGASLPLSHVPDSCSKHDRNVEDIAGIGDIDPEPAPSVCCSLQQTAGNVQQTTRSRPRPQLRKYLPSRRWHWLAVLLPRGSRFPCTAGLQRRFVHGMATTGSYGGGRWPCRRVVRGAGRVVEKGVAGLRHRVPRDSVLVVLM